MSQFSVLSGAAMAVAVVGLGVLAGAPAEAAAPPFPLGVYAGNPNGNSSSAEASFESRFNSFVTTMGAAPQFMNAFVDFSQPPANWPGNAGWTAWSWTQSKVVGHSLTPVIGIPMSDSWHWYGWTGSWSNDAFFKGITAGSYDSVYAGVVDAWVNAGFKTMYLRLGYEMDGGFMPWFMGNDKTTQADWVAAFQHLSVLMRAEAKKKGATAYAVWNPADINWTQLSVYSAYPGDTYVDVVSSDSYSPLYPTSLYDWSTGKTDPNIQTWWANPVNDAHFWTYPSANQWAQTGNGGGWGLADAIALATAHHKPIALSETGAGGNGTSTGPGDEWQFPRWLALKLAPFAQRNAVAYVNIWDTWMSDGDWAFSEPTDAKPLEAQAWSLYFGANALSSAAKEQALAADIRGSGK